MPAEVVPRAGREVGNYARFEAMTLSVVAAPLAPAQTLPRPGEDAVCLALLDQAYPLRTAHHLARKHPVRFVMLVVYAAGLLFIFLMRRQD